jgi:hypothetical protein
MLDHKHRPSATDNAVNLLMLGLSTLILSITLFFVVVDAVSFYGDEFESSQAVIRIQGGRH